MTRTTRIDWIAVNARGVAVRSFSDRASGRAWVKDNALLHDGLVLDRVEYTEARYRDYRPRLMRRADPFAIPAMGAA